MTKSTITPCGCEPPCADYDAWIEHHCYDCGGRTDQPGPRDVDHVLCFVGWFDLTPEQQAKLQILPHEHRDAGRSTPELAGFCYICGAALV